jgi:hypothetical protein
VSYTQLNSPREPVYEFNLERVFIDLFATGIQTIYLENEDSDDYVYHAKRNLTKMTQIVERKLTHPYLNVALRAHHKLL